MTTTALLTAGTTAATSSDFTNAVNASVYLYAKPATTLTAIGGAFWMIDIQKKTGTDYYTVASLTPRLMAVVLDGAGTFRLSRPVTVTSVGCDQET